MIHYDVVLEDLPERVRELTVRLRDLVLSQGPGLAESVGEGRLEYRLGGEVFAVLAPDRGGVSLSFPGYADKPPRDPKGRLSSEGQGALARLASAADIDDVLRRLLHETFARARGKGGAQTDAAEVPAELLQGLKNLSQTLRLLCHHLQVQEKAARQKAASAARVPERRSHKKKLPAVPPPLFAAEPPAAAPPASKARARSAPPRR